MEKSGLSTLNSFGNVPGTDVCGMQSDQVHSIQLESHACRCILNDKLGSYIQEIGHRDKSLFDCFMWAGSNDSCVDRSIALVLLCSPSGSGQRRDWIQYIN